MECSIHLPSQLRHAYEGRQLLESEGDMVDDVSVHIVTPGETITTDGQYMRGHGTYSLILGDSRVHHSSVKNGSTEMDEVVPMIDDTVSLVSSIGGVVQRVNKLVSVNAIRSRFTGDVGDVVVGRISEITIKRWKVDINSRQDGILLLSSVSLPGGIQRRRQETDELHMRQFFSEYDMVVTEVQQFYHDGAIGLHTRSTKYGKLRNGSLVIVQHSLMKRLPTHFHTLPCGVDVVLGLNGYIWVGKREIENLNGTGSVPVNTATTTITSNVIQEDPMYSNKSILMTSEERSIIARVCNAINALARNDTMISDTSIVYAYEASLQYEVAMMLEPRVAYEIAMSSRQVLAQMNQ